MPDAQLVEFFFDNKSGSMNQSDHISRVIHSAVSVCDTRKIQRDLVQAKCTGFLWLSIPKSLHDEEVCVRGHDERGLFEDRDDLIFPKTVEKLTHPDRIGVRWERLGWVK